MPTLDVHLLAAPESTELDPAGSIDRRMGGNEPSQRIAVRNHGTGARKTAHDHALALCHGPDHGQIFLGVLVPRRSGCGKQLELLPANLDLDTGVVPIGVSGTEAGHMQQIFFGPVGDLHLDLVPAQVRGASFDRFGLDETDSGATLVKDRCHPRQR